ncbi:hypothetical protein D8B26_005451 [Coccidioides posadasii str. Silveira]|uniref:uncharacterized protein n=1 Tax=Coccidioides posadasii (strain RMSCC 757 / Silveira) TaxID=443226 RepID=UPI001BF0404C|nr:hypothetical protein D8B26_005451 [Coccidioides posadasii str. Silveira]
MAFTVSLLSLYLHFYMHIKALHRIDNVSCDFHSFRTFFPFPSQRKIRHVFGVVDVFGMYFSTILNNYVLAISLNCRLFFSPHPRFLRFPRENMIDPTTNTSVYSAQELVSRC